MTLFREHRAFFIVLAFAAVLFLSDIWIYKEFVRAESYFALGSRLMMEQGDWLTPHAPDELPLNKPPLTYWLIGVSYKTCSANPNGHGCCSSVMIGDRKCQKPERQQGRPCGIEPSLTVGF